MFVKSGITKIHYNSDFPAFSHNFTLSVPLLIAAIPSSPKFDVTNSLNGEYLIEDLQVIEDLQKTYGRPTKMGDIYIKSDAILLIGIS